MNQTLKRPITLISAVAERMELRASEDRFSMGDAHLPISVD